MFRLFPLAVCGSDRLCRQSVLVRQLAGSNQTLFDQSAVVVSEIPNILPGRKSAGAKESEDFILRDF